MEERRQDYPRILEKLEDIRTEMTKVATLVEERNDSAIAWRLEVCKKFDGQNGKIDKMSEKLGELPCASRQEITNGVRKDLDKIWLWITSIVIAIVGSWVGMIIKR